MSCDFVVVPRPIVCHPSDDEQYICDFTLRLPAGVTIASATITQTDVAGESTSDLTIGTPAPNAVEIISGGATIAIGKGVAFQMSGGTADTERRLTCVAVCSDGFSRATVVRVIVSDGLDQTTA